MVTGLVAGSDAWSAAGSDVRLVASLVSLQVPLPAISGICGFEGLVADVSGYSSGIGICLMDLRVV